MAAIDFPASPTNGQLFTPANGITYRWLTAPGIWAVANGPVDTVIASDTPPASPVPNQLWFNASLAMLYVYYDDGNSQQWVPSMPVPAPTMPFITRIQWFGASGTYTPHANMTSGYVVGKGGGGASGGGAVTNTWMYGSAGGAEGNTVTTYFVRAQVTPTTAVTVGVGGTPITGGDGTAGGDTAFGASLLYAKGGGGGNLYVGGMAQNTGNVGHLLVYGAPGGSGNGTPYNQVIVSGSGGGAGGGRGSANGGPAGSTQLGTAGLANSGGGAGGSTSFMAGPGNIAGTNGGSGYLYVVEYCTS